MGRAERSTSQQAGLPADFFPEVTRNSLHVAVQKGHKAPSGNSLGTRDSLWEPQAQFCLLCPALSSWQPALGDVPGWAQDWTGQVQDCLRTSVLLLWAIAARAQDTALLKAAVAGSGGPHLLQHRGGKSCFAFVKEHPTEMKCQDFIPCL